MSVQSGRALNNVLLRWVQRHQTMTTLFHSHPVHPAHPMQTMPQQSEVSTVIQAKPSDVQMPTQPELRTVEPKVTTGGQVQAPLPVDATLKEAKVPAPSPRDAANQPDAGWKRLQTIFRKHQEQESPTIESIQAPGHSPDADQHIQQATNQPEPSKIPNGTKQTETPEVLQPPQTPPVIQRKADAADAQNTLIEHAALKPENKVQVSETQLLQVDRPSISLPETVKTKINQGSNQPKANFISSREPPTDFEEPGIEETQQSNALPLEAVWNVQRTQESEPAEQLRPRPARSNHAAVDSGTPKPVLQRSELESDVSTGDIQDDAIMDADDTSESRAPVEILAPSRPRPAPVNPVPSNLVVQRQPQEKPAPVEIPDERMIDTAIGPLPADLWQLLGQKPPAGASHPSAREPVRSAIQRAEEAPSQQNDVQQKNSSTPVKAIKLVDFPSVVQEQPAAMDTSSLPEQRHDASLSPEQTAAEPDVDELARKVYARIRQRLSTEWERLRRK